MKQCRSCGVEKKNSEFHKNQSRCKPCKSEIDRKYYENDRSNYYIRTYGISLSDFNAMFEEQEGCCAVCGTHQLQLKTRLCVDHDHATGKVRGLLCNSCNTALGKLKDNYDIAYRAADYLRSATS